ncbi:MAG: M20 family metallopeptidase [Myxococcales bacterium]|nr:M20 family metallopeptidase [Myxococcales bacterium]MCB9521691.1 M20 family metallopeptidase [Myxococcales bacterium]MCB9531907.1 M20 family metallopeptidase [Myxococcales bacterium]MCB9533875.1 M20 family metallopeptidase [Myxococcales bacterium]
MHDVASPSALIELLQRLVRSESVSGNEAAALQIWADFAESAGFAAQWHGRNVWIERRVNDGPALLFNSHLDTVKASSTWTRDPWDGALEEGRLHGLGANDAKGCVAAQIAAAVRLVATGFAGNVVVCASCDEETGGQGMEIVSKLLPRYDAAVIGEPNDFAVARGQRGLVKGYVHVPGRRAHASRPWQGHNAVHAAARAVVALERDDLNVPGDLTRATLQVTMIDGGLQSNVVPDHCKLTLDCRTTPEFDNAAMTDHIEAVAATVGGRFETYSDRFEPVHTPADSALVQAALEVTGAATPTVFPSVCDLFWVAHVPAVVMGPGRPERSHQADEFVLVDEVERGAELYAAIARAWWARVA